MASVFSEENPIIPLSVFFLVLIFRQFMKLFSYLPSNNISIKNLDKQVFCMTKYSISRYGITKLDGKQLKIYKEDELYGILHGEKSKNAGLECTLQSFIQGRLKAWW